MGGNQNSLADDKSECVSACWRGSRREPPREVTDISSRPRLRISARRDLGNNIVQSITDTIRRTIYEYIYRVSSDQYYWFMIDNVCPVNQCL